MISFDIVEPKAWDPVPDVIEIDGEWYYLDETNSHHDNGPYPSETKARAALSRYLHYLETGDCI